jgi:hypothetical protein
VTKYVIGRNFQVAGDQTMRYGEVAPEEVATWPNLQALISAKYLYPVADADTAAWLPSHLYSHVQNIQVARGIIEQGEKPDMEIDWTKPPVVQRAEELFELEKETRAQNARVAELRARHAHQTFQATQVSPRPIDLPPEEVFVDSKKREAESRVETGVDHLLATKDVEYDEGDDSVDVVAEEEDEAGKYSRPELQERARSWNQAHPDDKVPVNVNKPELEAALRERGVI